MIAAALHVRPIGIAIGTVVICALLIGLALSLPGRAAEGAVLGFGTFVASMLAFAHPDQQYLAAVGYAVTAIVGIGIALVGSPPGDPATVFRDRIRFWAQTLRLGGFWLAVPAAVVAALLARPAVGHVVNLAACLGVFVLVVTAARRRGRDISVGYVAGLLVGLAVLVAATYGKAAGIGVVLAYPADLTGVVGLACAGRIGVDRSFSGWQRVAALCIGAAVLVTVASPVAFVATGVACVAYVVLRLRGTRMPRPLREGRLTLALHAVGPLVVLAGLWAASLTSVSRSRRADFPRLAALGRTSTAGRLIGYTPSVPAGVLATGWIVIAVLLAGALLVAWRVTGPGLPLWIPVVGLGGAAGVLASGSGFAFGPSPAWVVALGAELWVICHGLRTDRNVIPAPALPPDSGDRT